MSKVILSNRNDKLVVSGVEDLHTKDGIISVEDLGKGGKLKSTLGSDFYVTEASFVDKLNKIKRGPAVMVAKAVGAIIGHTGLSKEWSVLDAGTGCGVLACYLSRIAKSVVSYDQREDHLKIAKKNAEMLECSVEFKLKDVYSGIDEKELNLVTLDLAEPWKVLDSSFTALKKGGYLVCYVPTVSQIQKLVENVDDTKFFVEKTLEVLEREWHTEGLKVRPKNRMLGHTGFLVFLRKI